MRGCRWGVGLPLLLVLSGCAASKPALQATWYFVDDKDSAGQRTTEMFVAILNQSVRPIPVREIIVNAPKGDPDAGWRSGPGPDLDPGEVRILPVTIFSRKDVRWKGKEAWWECRVPVAVMVVTGSDRRCPLVAETIGAMPTWVPEEWHKHCNRH